MHDFNSSIHASRRQRFLDQLGAAAAVIPAAPLATHHADCEWPFRQDSDFFYLTGFDEPDAVALLLPHRPEGERFVLFVQPKDPAAEVWTGFRWGTEGAVERYGADIALPLDQLSARLPEFLDGAEAIAFRVGRHPAVEPLVLSAWGRQLDSYARSGAAALGLVAPTPILHRLRLRKEPHELERMREACRISAEAHELARGMTRPGMNESEVQAAIEAHFRAAGARGPAYGSIVAGGDNACVLHYTANTAELQDGDLLLIDAGCSIATTTTATSPAPSRSTVASAPSSAISTAWCWRRRRRRLPSWARRHGRTGPCHRSAGAGGGPGGAGSLGRRTPTASLNGVTTATSTCTAPAIGLGLDVHDVGAYRLGEQPASLEPGMVLTVEPGLYISDRLAVPEGQPQIDDRWKGIGIRIEDDVAVTDSGHEVLTAAAQKSLAAMERS